MIPKTVTFFKMCAQLSSANFTVYDGIPTAWEGASLPPAYLKGNFLGSQLKSSRTKLFIPRHYSSSRAHQLTVGSSELLLLLHLSLLSNFPPLSSFLPLIANQPPFKPALHLPPPNFSGFVHTFSPARAFRTRSGHVASHFNHNTLKSQWYRACCKVQTNCLFLLQKNYDDCEFIILKMLLSPKWYLWWSSVYEFLRLIPASNEVVSQ